MTSQGYLNELFSLDRRVAVVTGGSSGIGLTSNASAYVTGQAIHVDGGFSVH